MNYMIAEDKIKNNVPLTEKEFFKKYEIDYLKSLNIQRRNINPFRSAGPRKKIDYISPNELFRINYDDGQKEYFEFKVESSNPRRNFDLQKTWMPFVTYANIFVTYSGLYDTYDDSFEEGVDVQFDSLLTFGLRLNQYEKSNEDHYDFTFFGGIGLPYVKIDYGYSLRDISQLRIRSPINIIHMFKRPRNNHEKDLYDTYYSAGGVFFEMANYKNYHLSNILKGIMINPTIELRYRHGENKINFAFGLSVGFSF